MFKQGLLKIGVLASAFIAVALVTSCNGQNSDGGSNPIIDGVDGPHVSIVNNAVTISATLNNVIFQGGLTLAVPHTQKSYIEVSPNVQTGGMLLQMGLDLDDIAGLETNANVLDPNQLPGGRPLPGIVGGQLPSIAVQVPQWNNATFYIGTAIVGVFIPVKFGAQGVTGTFLFYDSTGKKQIGTISIVGSDANGQNSGFLLLLNLKTMAPSSRAANVLM
jgi:hypothetical protein